MVDIVVDVVVHIVVVFVLVSNYSGKDPDLLHRRKDRARPTPRRSMERQRGTGNGCQWIIVKHILLTYLLKAHPWFLCGKYF